MKDFDCIKGVFFSSGKQCIRRKKVRVSWHTWVEYAMIQANQRAVI